MKEDFLHYVWQHRHFDFLKAKTTEGHQLDIIFPGYHNYDAGPDFLQAVISVDGVRWVGSVEIHCRSSDWRRHHHQFDEKYKSVILHVVYEHDMDIRLNDCELVPTLELRGMIASGMLRRYESLMGFHDELPCRSYLPNMGMPILQNQMSVAVMERMLHRQNSFRGILDSVHKDWNELIYRVLAVGFGCRKNANGFELLAQSLPYRVVRGHLSSKLQVYALIFGQAGLLDAAAEDDYVAMLRYEFDYLRYKYQLSPIGNYQWNWLRLRPQNFPTLRLAQFAQTLFEVGEDLQGVVLRSEVGRIRRCLSVNPDEYWQSHYQFCKPTARHPAAMGKRSLDTLIINSVAPLRFFNARFSGDDSGQELALSLLEEIGFENNSVTRLFEGTVFPQNSACDSQALLELYGSYCSRKRCLTCSVGDKIVRDLRAPPC